MASFNENLLNSSYDKGTRAVDSTPIGVRVARFPLSEAKNNIPISLTTGNQTMHVCSKKCTAPAGEKYLQHKKL